MPWDLYQLSDTRILQGPHHAKEGIQGIEQDVEEHAAAVGVCFSCIIALARGQHFWSCTRTNITSHMLPSSAQAYRLLDCSPHHLGSGLADCRRDWLGYSSGNSDISLKKGTLLYRCRSRQGRAD